MYKDAPGPFKLVDLNDRRTFHRATLQEWIDLRDELVQKREKNKTTPKRWKAYMGARTSAIKQIWRENGLSRKKKKPPITGPLEKRFHEIMKEKFYDKHQLDGGMTPWELEFLRASEWIDELSAKYYSDHYAQGLVRRLTDWIITIEEEHEIAIKRKKLRLQYADSVSVTPSKQMPYGKNPYLPNPLELIGIYRATLITIARMEIGIHQIHIKSGLNAKPEEVPAVARYNSRRVSEFVRWIRGLGYPMYRHTEDASTWDGWSGLGKKGRATLTIAFLGYIFNVSPRTIARGISQSSLKRQYDEFAVAESARDYLTGRSELRAVRVMPPRWFERLEDGMPNLYEPARGFFPPQHR